MSPARIRIITLGCKVNQCDGDEMACSLAGAGYDLVREGEADLYIVNTCTVTATADAKARKLIRKLARAAPGAKLIVTGCGAERDADAVGLPPGLVVPNAHKGEIVEAVEALVGRACLRMPAARGRQMAGDKLLPNGRPVASFARSRPMPPAGRTRFFLKIQDGCDHHCAYCAVPAARGRPASKPIAQVLDDLQGLAQAGTQEVVLCGIRLGAYGRERAGFTLAQLLHALRDLPIPRLRLSSLEPMDIDDELVGELAGHPRLCHHLHLPLQSGDDGVLADMGRGYRAADYAGILRRVRTHWPEAAITTDVMVGFPGETDEQFARTLEFVSRIGFARVHVFPYSPRPGTEAAARRDQVPPGVRRERVEKLLRVAEDLAQRAAQAWAGREVSVLFEEQKAGRLTGLTEQYVRVWCEGPTEWVGRMARVRAGEAIAGELLVRP